MKHELERRVRERRRAIFTEYFENRRGVDRRADDKRLKDNAFISNWVETFHAHKQQH